MKKHFLYVSTAALLAMSFASCVDNDEPRGLRELRYAKANEWNANADWKRATIYGDSLLHVFNAEAQNLLNRAQELVNIENEALYQLTVKGKQLEYDLAKAKNDVSLAEQEYKLAEMKLTGDKAIADAKEKVVKAQQALEVAQYAYDTWTAQAQNRKDSITVQVNNEKAKLANSLTRAQDALNRNKLYAEEVAAKLEADTYKKNLDNLILVAAAKKDVWATAQNKVWDAYSNLKTAQGNMLDKQTALFQAQQKMLIALNKYEEDSAAKYKLIKDSINDLQYKLDWAEKTVTLVEKEFKDFKDNSETNKETWTKKYNEYQKAIDKLSTEFDEYDVQIAEAKSVKTADSLKYENKKKEIEKPLEAYNNKRGYYTFVLDDAIADDEDFALPTAADSFKLDQGVIAAPKGILNKNLNAQLDAILKYIGDDDATTNKFYLDEDGIKAEQKKIKAAEDEIAGLEKQLVADSTGYISNIDAKKSLINTKTQELTERKNQNEVETKFNTQKTTFEAAVTAYKAAALAYKWSDVAAGGAGKSTYYELVAAPAVAAAIVKFNQAYYAETQKDPGDQDFYNTNLTKLRKDIQDKAKSSDYWALRTAFDGTVKYEKDDETIAKNFFLFNNWTNDSDPELVPVASFDGYVFASDKENPDADEVNGLVDVLLGGNVRNTKDGGAYKAYVDAAVDFIGAADKYVAYTAAEIEQMDDTELGTKGTTGELNLWKREIAALEKEIAEAKSDDTDADQDGVYDNPGIAQFEELLAKAQEKRDADVEEQEEKIEESETKIANSALWKALYDAIAEVKDANDDQIKELTIAQQEAYKTELVSLEEAVTADQKKIDDLKLAQSLVKAEKEYKELAAKTYSKLVLTDVNKYKDATNGGVDLTDADIEAEIIIKYAEINFQFKIDQAKENVAQVTVDLNKVKQHLADFEAGEFSVADNDYVATVNNAQKAVTNAELEYEHATKEYEVAQKYYEDILASVEAE
jgi:hypothetical protein